MILQVVLHQKRQQIYHVSLNYFQTLKHSNLIYLCLMLTAPKVQSRTGSRTATPNSQQRINIKTDNNKLNDNSNLPTDLFNAKQTQQTNEMIRIVDKEELKRQYNEHTAGKDVLNLIIIGHVDAGKSTMMGHFLYQIGHVSSKQMHKFKQESQKIGKSSFAYAWVLDETEEERSRGVTIDIAQVKFETEKKIVNLLDAPGHRDFIPNMITGAASADTAILVINSATGGFETGFELGGQTREHSLLAKSLGVSQIIVALNKMDLSEWSQVRFEDICKKLNSFLTKQVGFKENDIKYIPVSGLTGENLIELSTNENLTKWYTNQSAIEQVNF
jgi:elongation factor 1 alpha-like protein